MLIPERYDLEDVENEQPLTEEEQQLKLEKSEKYRKMLAAHRLDLSLDYTRRTCVLNTVCAVCLLSMDINDNETVRKDDQLAPSRT